VTEELSERRTAVVIEDDADIRQLLETVLEQAGFETVSAANGLDGVEAVRTHNPLVTTLDVSMPGIDGFEAAKRIRAISSTYIVMLTARGDEIDTLQGLDSGADDYMTKPFRFEELLARVRLRLRSADREVDPSVLRHGDLALDLRTRVARSGDREVELTSREFVLLDLFLRHAGQVLSREEILLRVWGLDFDPGSNVVDVYVRALRKKIGAERIGTVRGMGYRLAGRA